ncbi:MAG TPA: RNB domain-containing ribonuclease [Actinocatenispora sp.]
MQRARIHAPRIDFGALRRELELPDEFPPEVRLAAEEAASVARAPARERTDLPLVTLDPLGSRDLDQAMGLVRRRGGFRLHYAIADVAAFVAPGGALDGEAWRRSQTIYFPDTRVPLHPPVLSEGAASLLPGQVRPALLWTIDLDDAAEPTAVRLERAMVRSRAQLDYPAMARALSDGGLPAEIAALPEVGRLRRAAAVGRGAIELNAPEAEVEPDGTGWRLVLRSAAPMEEHNAQVSLLTGMCAAQIMLAGGVGVLRTLPAAQPADVTRVQAGARALGIDWPADATAAQVLASVDPGTPRGAAFLDLAATLLRGAGYTPFDGAAPKRVGHAGVGSSYAHVTAPLRRLVDRYALEVCLALVDGRDVPDWARRGLARLPSVMSAGDQRASAAERAVVDLTEAVLLAGRVGETFDAAVVDVGTVALDDPPVRARCEGEDLPVGDRVRVRLVEADPATRRVLFRH